MKKSLLLVSVACTAMTVSAQVEVRDAAVAETAVRASVSVADKAECAAVSAPVLKVSALDAVPFDKAQSVQNAEGDAETTYKPYYILPEGAFFGRTILDGQDAGWVRRPLYMPAGRRTWYNKTTFAGSTPSELNLVWKYSNLVETADGLGLEDATAPGIANGYYQNLTTDYRMYVSGITVPALDFNGVASYGDAQVEVSGGGTAARYLIRTGGRATGNTSSGTYPWSMSNYDFYQYDGWAANGAKPESYDSFVFTNYNNWTINSTTIFSDATIIGYATDLDLPEDVYYGVSNVIVNAWVTAELTAPLKVDFYKKEFVAQSPETPTRGWYVTGERIGGGWLNPDEVTTDNYNQRLVIPMREGEGDFVSETFVNLSGSVVAVISCDGLASGVVKFPVITIDPTNSVLWGYGSYVLNVAKGTTDENDPVAGMQLYRMSNLDWDDFQGLATASPIAIDMNFDGCYSSIDLQSDANVVDGMLQVDFTANETEKTVIVEPYFNIDSNGKFTAVGDAEEWLFASADDWNDQYEQPINIYVDPLPAGVAGRAGVLKVEVPGAVLNILVRQGDTSGIDSINGDAADVVSSQICDLQGRQLNAVPESGLYIRRDVKADNTVSTVKVVK